MPDFEQDSHRPVGPAPFTVEVNRSYDPVQQSWDQQIFIKLYTTALATGFLAALSDRDWKTLCVIALHMDEAGRCYPSRTRIAQALGVSHTTASARIQSLLDVRWNGQPLVRATRERLPNGTLGRQVYTILPIVPLGFGPQNPPSGASDVAADLPEASMSRNLDMAAASDQVKISQHGDLPTWHVANMGTHQHGHVLTSTNKIQDLNKNQENQEGAKAPCLSDGPIDAAYEEQVPKPPTVVASNYVEDETVAPSAERRQRRTRDRASDDATGQQVAQYLKVRLAARGMTVFPRDWHLKAGAKVRALLKAGLAPPDLYALIDWCLAHPFWSDKVTTMDKVADLVGQWQMQQKGGIANGTRVSGVDPARRHPNSGTLDSLVIR